MSAILEPPTSVLATSGDRSFEWRLRDALAGVEDADVQVTDPEDATDPFDEHRYETGAVVARVTTSPTSRSHQFVPETTPCP